MRHRGETMRHKILISGTNSALITDFIQQTEAFFKTMSTSENQQDILWHFKLFDPEAYVCFVGTDYQKTVNQVHNLKANGGYNGAVIVFIGDEDTCDLIERRAVPVYDLLIRRPVTPDNLTLRIIRYFDDLNEAREREKAEASRLVQQARADARQTAVAGNPAGIAAKENKEIESSGGKKHILIVDDDRTVLKMLKSALENTYDVTVMVNGIMVDKLLDTKKVDLIILDYEMPVETGADIFRRLKKNPKASHIPVCFLTGITDRDKIMEVMLLKPDGYLLKPIDMSMLSTTIKNLTDRTINNAGK